MTETPSPALYSVAPGVETCALDVGAKGEDPSYLVEVDAQSRYEVTAGVHRVIELARDGPRSAEELVERLREEGNGSATADKIAWLIRSVLLPRGILRRVSGGTAGEPSEPGYRPVNKRSSYLWVKVPLFGPEAVRPLTRFLHLLFRPAVALPILITALGVYLYFYTAVLGGLAWSLSALPAGHAVALVLALNLNTVFHELGHVSACRHFGSPHGKIGWGIYLFMFVLYADVSEVWRLKRWQRAIVDAGGMYFEVVATLIVFALYLATGEPLFAFLFVFINLSIATSLNPILRRDGYWLLADLTGMANLRDANLDALRYGLRRLTFREAGSEPPLVRRPRLLQAVLLLYSAASVVFSIALVWWLGKRVVGEVIPASAALVEQIGSALGDGAVEAWSLLAAGGRVAFQAFFVVLVGLAAWNMTASLVRALLRSPDDDRLGTGVRAEWKGQA